MANLNSANITSTSVALFRQSPPASISLKKYCNYRLFISKNSFSFESVYYLLSECLDDEKSSIKNADIQQNEFKIFLIERASSNLFRFMNLLQDLGVPIF